MKQGKIWGTTELLLRTPIVEVHRLTVRPYSGCSVHMHAYKHNAFYVRTGKLLIEVEKKDYDLTDTTLLMPGDFTTVRPGEYHTFRTEDEPCEAIEMYYLEQLSEDIVRKDAGWVTDKQSYPYEISTKESRR